MDVLDNEIQFQLKLNNMEQTILTKQQQIQILQSKLQSIASLNIQSQDQILLVITEVHKTMKGIQKAVIQLRDPFAQLQMNSLYRLVKNICCVMINSVKIMAEGCQNGVERSLLRYGSKQKDKQMGQTLCVQENQAQLKFLRQVNSEIKTKQQHYKQLQTKMQIERIYQSLQAQKQSVMKTFSSNVVAKLNEVRISWLNMVCQSDKILEQAYYRKKQGARQQLGQKLHRPQAVYKSLKQQLSHTIKNYFKESVEKILKKLYSMFYKQQYQKLKQEILKLKVVTHEAQSQTEIQGMNKIKQIQKQRRNFEKITKQLQQANKRNLQLLQQYITATRNNQLYICRIQQLQRKLINILPPNMRMDKKQSKLKKLVQLSRRNSIKQQIQPKSRRQSIGLQQKSQFAKLDAKFSLLSHQINKNSQNYNLSTFNQSIRLHEQNMRDDIIKKKSKITRIFSKSRLHTQYKQKLQKTESSKIQNNSTFRLKSKLSMSEQKQEQSIDHNTLTEVNQQKHISSNKQVKKQNLNQAKQIIKRQQKIDQRIQQNNRNNKDDGISIDQFKNNITNTMNTSQTRCKQVKEQNTTDMYKINRYDYQNAILQILSIVDKIKQNQTQMKAELKIHNNNNQLGKQSQTVIKQQDKQLALHSIESKNRQQTNGQIQFQKQLISMRQQKNTSMHQLLAQKVAKDPQINCIFEDFVRKIISSKINSCKQNGSYNSTNAHYQSNKRLNYQTNQYPFLPNANKLNHKNSEIDIKPQNIIDKQNSKSGDNGDQQQNIKVNNNQNLCIDKQKKEEDKQNKQMYKKKGKQNQKGKQNRSNIIKLNNQQIKNILTRMSKQQTKRSAAINTANTNRIKFNHYKNNSENSQKSNNSQCCLQNNKNMFFTSPSAYAFNKNDAQVCDGIEESQGEYEQERIIFEKLNINQSHQTHKKQQKIRDSCNNILRDNIGNNNQYDMKLQNRQTNSRLNHKKYSDYGMNIGNHLNVNENRNSVSNNNITNMNRNGTHKVKNKATNLYDTIDEQREEEKANKKLINVKQIKSVQRQLVKQKYRNNSMNIDRWAKCIPPLCIYQQYYEQKISKDIVKIYQKIANSMKQNEDNNSVKDDNDINLDQFESKIKNYIKQTLQLLFQNRICKQKQNRNKRQSYQQYA